MSRSDRAYHHGNLGPALEEAALQLLEEQSHSALSLREVARRAGVSHNAPYHHFGDRQQLLKRVSERAMRELLAAQQRAAASTPEGKGQVLAVGSAYLTYAVEHPHAFSAIFDPEVCVPGAPSEAMAPLIEANERLLADVARPVWGEDGLDLRCAGLWGAVHGLATLVIAGHLPTEAGVPALAAVIEATDLTGVAGG